MVSQGIPRPDEICHPSSKFWVYPGVSSQFVVLWKKPKGRLISVQRSSGSTLSSLHMSTLLTLSLRLGLTNLRRKLNLVSWISNLIFFCHYPVLILLILHQTTSLSLAYKTLKYLNSFTWGRNLSTHQKGAICCFPAENHGFRLGGADTHTNHFLLGYKPSQSLLVVTDWRSQQNHVLYKTRHKGQPSSSTHWKPIRLWAKYEDTAKGTR